MCGIAGFVGKARSSPEQERILKNMVHSMEHRGPDDAGLFHNESMALGMRRLSIIDLARGHQPIFNETKTLAIVFNGEIYNYLELRAELVKKGHVFSTQSDTEVILHLYEEVGSEVSSHLNGMFAIAILDLQANQLFLSRDRFGEKPLYYFQSNSELVFASELRTLSKHPLFPKDLDWDAIKTYLQHELIPSPQTPFKQVFQLEPGCSLTYSPSKGKAQIQRYWSIENSFQSSEGIKDAEEFEELFSRAVNSRMKSDVPVGAFLSGGLDSSLVISQMRAQQNAPLKTFCIGFSEKSFDESAYAKEVSDILDVQLELQVLTSKNILDLIPQIFSKMDCPIADPSFLPTYLVSRLAARHGKVILSGDAGDELFGGYPTYQAHWFAERTPEIFLNLGQGIARSLPISDKNFSFQFKLERFCSAKRLDWAERHLKWLGAFKEEEADALLQGRVSSRYEDPLLFWTKRLGSLHPIQKAMLTDQRFYMGENILTKVDRASMATSLEVRTPFLDHRLVEKANATPLEKKWSWNKSKILLRETAAKQFPKSISQRPKKGFGIPLTRWFCNELRPFMEETFSPESLKKAGLVEPAPAMECWQDHLHRRKDNRKALWTLVSLHYWRKSFFS
jgi:asparagine synthase (glutamine-hydrolysing)